MRISLSNQNDKAPGDFKGFMFKVLTIFTATSEMKGVTETIFWIKIITKVGFDAQ